MSRRAGDPRTAGPARPPLAIAAGATLASAALMAAACTQPTQPSRPDLADLPFLRSAALALAPGPHWLNVVSFALSNIPEFPPCTLSGGLRPGTDVVTEVILERRGGTWIGRASPAAAGDLELRFQAGAGTLWGIPVAGTIRGSAIDFGYVPFLPARDLRVAFGEPGAGPARLEGTGSIGHAFVHGRIDGPISFRDSGGHTAVCRAAMWSLQPVRR